MQPLRVYLDTSVFGGSFDPEFAEDSTQLFEGVRRGWLTVLLSDIVVRELSGAPENVRRVLASLPRASIEPVELTREVWALRDAYVSAGIVGPRWLDDAAHVAAATVARADAIVSWNFAHIVRLDKIKAYNQVNFSRGYGIVGIVSPKEVIASGPQEE